MPTEGTNPAKSPGPLNRTTRETTSTSAAPTPALAPSRPTATASARESTTRALATLRKAGTVLSEDAVGLKTVAEALTHIAYNTNRIPKSVQEVVLAAATLIQGLDRLQRLEPVTALPSN